MEQIKYQLISASNNEPISITEAKSYLRINNDHDDEFIEQLIKAVRVTAEQYLGFVLIEQNWQAHAKGYQSNIILSPNHVIAIEEVSCIMLNNDQHLIPESHYCFDDDEVTISARYYNANRIMIKYKVGYKDSALIAIKQGMLAHIAAIYDGRLDGSSIPIASRSFYGPYRKIRI